MSSENDTGGDRIGEAAVLTTALRRGLGALGDAAMPVPSFDDLVSPMPAGSLDCRRHRRLLAGVGVATAAVVLAVVLVIGRGPFDGGIELAVDSFGAAGWKEIDAGPLSARNQATLVWTGREVIVVGGDTFTCGGDCDAPDTPLLADGAAYDSATDTWRTIADAPLGFAGAPGVIVGDDLYIRAFVDGRDRGSPTLLRYSVADDVWDSIEIPTEVGPAPLLAGLPGAVLVFADSDVESQGPGWLYDPAGETWAALPPDPLAPSYLRTMVWAEDRLWLFAKASDDIESGRPPVVGVASYDPGTGQWLPGAVSDMLATGPWLVDGAILVNPSLGCDDGGAEYNWGRCVANGGRYDTATDTWMSLPDEPEAGTNDVTSGGAIGSDGAVLLTPGGHLLDAQFGRWQTLPAIGGDDPGVKRQIIAIGVDAFTFGNADDGFALADGWIWRSGRQLKLDPSPVTPPRPSAPTTSTTMATTPISPATTVTTAIRSTTSTATSTTNTTSATTRDTKPSTPVRSWKDLLIVARSPVCVPADLPPGIDVTTPIYFKTLGDPASKRLDLITSSAVYTAVDCSWVTILGFQRVPGVSDWRCQDYEDGSEIELWDFAAGTVTQFPVGGGAAPIGSFERPGLLFGLASCDSDNPANAPPPA